MEGENKCLQWLKSHKEKLEEGMRELRRKNEELERERDEGEKERERMRRCIDQLRAKLAQAQVRSPPKAGKHLTIMVCGYLNTSLIVFVSPPGQQRHRGGGPAAL